MRITVTLDSELWLYRDDNGGWWLSPAPLSGHPGAYVPRPRVLPEGTLVDLEVWHDNCEGCKTLRHAAGSGNELYIEHTHGAP